MEDKKKELHRGGITAPAGFLAAGVFCGIKESGEPDLAIIYSEVPCAAAALYTTNLFRAAPLQVTEKHLEDGKLQAVVVQRRQRQRLHRREGDAPRPVYGLGDGEERHRRFPRRPGGQARGRGGGFHRRYRREDAHGQRGRGHPPGRLGTEPGRLRGRRPGHRHHRHLRQAGGTGRQRLQARRHHQGGGHDQTQHGYHAVLPHHRRRSGLPGSSKTH